MRFEAIFIESGALVYPPILTVPELLEQGMVTAEESAMHPGIGVPVSPDLGAPRLAVHAARDALANAGLAAEDLTVNIHSWLHHQGHDMWSPQHYIASELGANDCLPIGIQEMCNGGETSMEIAAMRLSMENTETRALTTTADIFAASGFDRFRGDYGLWYGDAGTALCLTNQPSPEAVRLLSATSRGVSFGEGLHRGDDDFTATPGERGRVDVRRTKKAFLAAGGGERFGLQLGGALRYVVLRSLRMAGIDPYDERVRYLALPRIDTATLKQLYLPVLVDVTAAQFYTDPTRPIGHLGSGDTPANLIELVAKGDHNEGDIALLVCAGGGFTVSCACVELPAPTAGARRFSTTHGVVLDAPSVTTDSGGITNQHKERK